METVNPESLFIQTLKFLFQTYSSNTQLEILRTLTEEANTNKRLVNVVYNNHYGGFGLSPLACKILKRLDSRHKDIHTFNLERYYEEKSKRDHPYLIAIVERLGVLANGSHCKLKIKECKLGLAETFDISEYDGYEDVLIIPCLDEYTPHEVLLSTSEVNVIIDKVLQEDNVQL